MYMIRFCIFVVLCVDETYYFICVKIVMQKNSPNPPPPPSLLVVGRDYRLSNFWLAKEVNKELRKKLLHQCL
jgi:hypothetical protein